MKNSANSASHFGDLVILVDLTPVPDIKFQNPQQGTWLVCRRGWFGILFLRSLIGWSHSSVEHRSRPLNKKVSKNPFWISSNISLLQLNWLEKCLKTLNFWLAGNLFSKTGKTERNWSTRKSSPSRFPNFASRMMFHNSKKCLQPNGKYSLKEACKERKQEHTVRKTFLGKSCVFFWDLLLRILGEVGKLLLVRRTSFFPPVGEKPHKLCWTLFSYFTLS